MPVNPTYPGVYIQEAPSGARAIAGVATSITAFVGMAERGPMNVPTRIFNFADFERTFGPTSDGEMAAQVQNFYLNGGGTAYIVRIANGADFASVTLRNEANSADVLEINALHRGTAGNALRVEVDYATANSEDGFNLTVFREGVDPNTGNRTRDDEERFEGLSMDPNSGFYVEDAIRNGSQLISVEDISSPGAVSGISMGGRLWPTGSNAARDALIGILGTDTRRLVIQVGAFPPEPVTLRDATGLANPGAIATQIQEDLNAALAAHGVSVSVTVSPAAAANGGTGSHRTLRIETTGDGPVRITPAAQNDATVLLGLGIAQGGLEASTYGGLRPAPSGVVAMVGSVADDFRELRDLAGTGRGTITGNFTISDDSGEADITGPVDISQTDANPLLLADDASTTFANVFTAIDEIVTAINDAPNNDRWIASRAGGRLALRPNYGGANSGAGTQLTTPGYNYDATALSSVDNTARYIVGAPNGVAGTSPRQNGFQEGLNGATPLPPDYLTAYDDLERDAEFNLLTLPRAPGQSNAARRLLWGPASAACERLRAFLIVDPDDDWTNVTQAENGVNSIRIGVATRNAACYWPRLAMGGGVHIDPSGAMAGVMARTDGNRGVWKAPAGLEATIRGVRGVEHQMTDPENGVINIQALNALRLFPSGVVSWGARTLVGFNTSGNVDDKYIPVRRTMLFIEESLYRGLRFAVFEPNDEPLWAQIRVAAGGFMNGFFRQGAFQGSKASDAYFVRCDATTTTERDRLLGIVNVIVGFAPLKPAEFVIVTVQQIAGQDQS